MLLDPREACEDVHHKNMNKLTFAQLNENSLCNKFESMLCKRLCKPIKIRQNGIYFLIQEYERFFCIPNFSLKKINGFFGALIIILMGRLYGDFQPQLNISARGVGLKYMSII